MLQNSWRLEILSELPLFKLDSKAALACNFQLSTGLSRIKGLHWQILAPIEKIKKNKILILSESPFISDACQQQSKIATSHRNYFYLQWNGLSFYYKITSAMFITSTRACFHPHHGHKLENVFYHNKLKRLKVTKSYGRSNF